MTASINNSSILAFPITPNPVTKSDKGWSYLLADSLAFQRNVNHGIRIQKPDEEKVPVWIRRLITSGKCTTIYVENLALQDQDQEQISQLCAQYSVSLVSLKVDTNRSNVIRGPW